MDRAVIEEKLLEALASIAPEVRGERIDAHANLQDQLDLDSVDILNYIIRVQNDFHIEVSNKDYHSFLTIEGATAYLANKNLS